jgi:hypothetical protein
VREAFMAASASDSTDLRKQAWDYFQLHASQRLTTFNFYIVISSLLTTGLLGTFQKDYKTPFLGAGLGALLTFLSFVFWKLDERNKLLIKNAESALRHFESLVAPAPGSEPHVTQLFLREEWVTDKTRCANSWRRRTRSRVSEIVTA